MYTYYGNKNRRRRHHNVVSRIKRRHAARQALLALDITTLRQKSRGVVSGGYSLRKEALVDALLQKGVSA